MKKTPEAPFLAMEVLAIMTVGTGGSFLFKKVATCRLPNISRWSSTHKHVNSTSEVQWAMRKKNEKEEKRRSLEHYMFRMRHFHKVNPFQINHVLGPIGLDAGCRCLRSTVCSCTETDSWVTGLGVSDVQGNMPAVFVEMNCESSFSPLEKKWTWATYGLFQILSVPPEGIRSTIS